MKKTIGIERTFFLGQFKNIRYSTTVEDIPDELFFNEEFMEALKESMLLEADKIYFKYIKESLTFVDGINTEEALEKLDEMSVNTLEKKKKAYAEVATKGE